MAELPTPKSLSYAGILAIAANTMNGPAFTTLPDVAADAGLGLYVVLIALSVAMAAFVCRRMVYAMWSSLLMESDEEAGIAGSDGKAEETDEPVPGAAKDVTLTHREHDTEEKAGVQETETAPLISDGDGDGDGKDHPSGSVYLKQPSLEKTSIVGQSLEAYGTNGQYYAALAMVASALCLVLAQMMLCAGAVDELLVSLGGKTCALGWPSSVTDDDGSTYTKIVYCSTHASMKPFEGTDAPVSLLSVGWFVAAVASVAMGTLDLDDMIGLQYFLFGCLALSAARFSYVLAGMANALYGTDGGEAAGRMLEEAAAGGAVERFVGPNPFQTIGPIMFNFAFIVTSPSSVVLARKDTTASEALGMSCVVMGVMYAMVGLTGAAVSNAVKAGMIEGETDSNLLSLIMMSGGEDGCSKLDLCMIALFSFSTVAAIPVYCILSKETLINDAKIAKLPSFVLSNILPWIIVALTYNAAFFDAFVNWSGLLILGYTNFSLPLLLDLKLKTVRVASAVGKKFIDDDAMTRRITHCVMILVTASITSVVVISIADSLTLAVVAFLCTAVLAAKV